MHRDRSGEPDYFAEVPFGMLEIKLSPKKACVCWGWWCGNQNEEDITSKYLEKPCSRISTVSGLIFWPA